MKNLQIKTHTSATSLIFFLLIFYLNSAVAEEIYTNQFEQNIALRTSELAIVDPHIFTLVAGIACLDITNEVNAQIQTTIDTDGNDDGFLDLSTVIQFSTDQIDYLTSQPLIAQSLNAQCADPLHSEACTISDVIQGDIMTLPSASSDCLAAEAGTTGNYSPAPNTTTAPCYASDAIDTVLSLAGVDVTVKAFQTASRYQLGMSADQGLNKAFITETDAENITFPDELPVIGGQTLASLLPGGNGNCSGADDRDIFSDNQSGWWLYFNTTSEIIELQ